MHANTFASYMLKVVNVWKMVRGDTLQGDKRTSTRSHSMLRVCYDVCSIVSQHESIIMQAGVFSYLAKSVLIFIIVFLYHACVAQILNKYLIKFYV